MTAEEYVQLKAFARIDGAMLSVWWLISFACYIHGTVNPAMSIVALLLIMATPFLVGKRVGRFRDEAREGIISFMRAYAYAILVFFYAGLLFAIIQYVYFAYIDHGYLLSKIAQAMASPESQQALQQLGMTTDMEEGMTALEAMRPIDYALNMLSINISAGIVLGLPIAAVMKRQIKKTKK